MNSNEKEAEHQRKRGLSELLAEGKRNPVIVFLAVVAVTISSTITGTVVVLRSGFVPRSWYMPPTDVARLERLESAATVQPSPADEGNLSIRVKPAPPEDPPPDAAEVKKITPRGMEAVRFMLRFHSEHDAGKERLGKENNGHVVDWDLVVRFNLGIIAPIGLTLDCEPLYWNHWHRDRVSVTVHVDQKFENGALVLEPDTWVHVRGTIEIKYGEVFVNNSTIEPIKQP